MEHLYLITILCMILSIVSAAPLASEPNKNVTHLPPANSTESLLTSDSIVVEAEAKKYDSPILFASEIWKLIEMVELDGCPIMNEFDGK